MQNRRWSPHAEGVVLQYNTLYVSSRLLSTFYICFVFFCGICICHQKKKKKKSLNVNDWKHTESYIVGLAERGEP